MQKPAIFMFCPGCFSFRPSRQPAACGEVAASSALPHSCCQGFSGSPSPGGKVPNPFLQDALPTFSPNQG